MLGRLSHFSRSVSARAVVLFKTVLYRESKEDCSLVKSSLAQRSSLHGLLGAESSPIISELLSVWVNGIQIQLYQQDVKDQS